MSVSSAELHTAAKARPSDDANRQVNSRSTACPPMSTGWLSNLWQRHPLGARGPKGDQADDAAIDLGDETLEPGMGSAGGCTNLIGRITRVWSLDVTRKCPGKRHDSRLIFRACSGITIGTSR